MGENRGQFLKESNTAFAVVLLGAEFVLADLQQNWPAGTAQLPAMKLAIRITLRGSAKTVWERLFRNDSPHCSPLALTVVRQAGIIHFVIPRGAAAQQAHPEHQSDPAWRTRRIDDSVQQLPDHRCRSGRQLDDTGTNSIGRH
jgi:hypothetical protein